MKPPPVDFWVRVRFKVRFGLELRTELRLHLGLMLTLGLRVTLGLARLVLQDFRGHLLLKLDALSVTGAGIRAAWQATRSVAGERQRALPSSAARTPP